MSADIFLNGRVQLCCGDSLHFLRDQPDDRYDSVVTDPPYALVSIAKRYGAADSKPSAGIYGRGNAGFMGKKWDTGETAFAVEFWQHVLRVLKPGGHVVAFGGTGAEPRGDSGSAARFFYSAKADADDRLGSKHPTVKPVDLMQWLVRLVTPKNGLVLDPFAGTGTTAEACYREGMRCMLVERETEYQGDIRRRMALVLGSPDERRRESIKAKNFPIDHGPLFSEIGDAADV